MYLTTKEAAFATLLARAPQLEVIIARILDIKYTYGDLSIDVRATES